MCWWCFKHVGGKAETDNEDLLSKGCPEEFKTYCREVDVGTHKKLLASAEQSMASATGG
jgi:hypothetical protein